MSWQVVRARRRQAGARVAAGNGDRAACSGDPGTAALLQGKASSTMVVAWIGFRAQPHKRPEILSAIDEMIDRMRSSAGCGRGRLLVDCDDPNTFTVLSEWQSVDAANAFFESRGFQLFRGIRMLLRGEPFVVFDEVQHRVTRLLR
jgi:quinol monooxygenase YgiN